jgi:hypothetical protein
MKTIIKLFSVSVILILVQSCTKDLNRKSENTLYAEDLYSSDAGYQSALAKIYSGLALTGNAGPDGLPDLVGAGSGVGEGFESYLRNYFFLQELSTDETVTAWNDNTLRNLHYMTWTGSDIYVGMMYSRIFYQVSLANSFIKESTDEKLQARKFTGAALEKIKVYRAEARFMRALSYLHAIDLYGNPSFVTENDPIGTNFSPKPITRKELFNYIENECKAIEGVLPVRNDYGRAGKAAVWMLLSNLYLNAKVYTGEDKNTEAALYASKVINEGGYSLQPKYGELFMADNDKSPEIIFPIEFDGVKTRTWGGTTLLTYSSIGGNMNAKDYGMSGGWWSFRTTKAIVNKFGSKDKRGNFYTNGQSLEINDIGDFFQGYPVVKYVNKKSDGTNGSSDTWVDIDFPVFRLAEAYLNYSEAILRGGTGSTNLALNYVNLLRQRAGEDPFKLITLNDLLDERAREFLYEAKRRTDLVRFGKFTSSDYVWPWKGNVKDGKGVEVFRNLYPIPAAEINSNPNLKQNEGY